MRKQYRATQKKMEDIQHFRMQYFTFASAWTQVHNVICT